MGLANLSQAAHVRVVCRKIGLPNWLDKSTTTNVSVEGAGLSYLEPLLEFLTARRVRVLGNSMSPTYREGQTLVVSRRAYRHRLPSRFDVVLVAALDGQGREDLKRIVGLPGEEVSFSEGVLGIDGEIVDEPHLALALDAPEDSFEWRTGEIEYVVLGDNRTHSADSRDYGAVDLKQIVGPVIR